MAISRLAVLGIVGICLGAGGCADGSRSANSTHGARSSHLPRPVPHSRDSTAFGWLQPGPPPPRWSVVAIAGGGKMSYPARWTRIHSDPGTASVASFDHAHHFLAYLNITPQQGDETLANWARFRIDHNAEDEDHDVRLLEAGNALRFRDGPGACVKDRYTTTIGSRYVELACLIAGRKSGVVIVAASPSRMWNRTAPLLERAISAVRA